MNKATFILSAFGDEIADDLATQLDVLAEEGVPALGHAQRGFEFTPDGQ